VHLHRLALPAKHEIQALAVMKDYAGEGNWMEENKTT
jgi:hypothetical protein